MICECLSTRDDSFDLWAPKVIHCLPYPAVFIGVLSELAMRSYMKAKLNLPGRRIPTHTHARLSASERCTRRRFMRLEVDVMPFSRAISARRRRVMKMSPDRESNCVIGRPSFVFLGSLSVSGCVSSLLVYLKIIDKGRRLPIFHRCYARHGSSNTELVDASQKVGSHFYRLMRPNLSSLWNQGKYGQFSASSRVESIGGIEAIYAHEVVDS
ncbi:hypothetical protein BV22DRAFT_862577 [Leucogyrophana mollusca]|uniref:Uncharacterized protein n=1 Tax=Leucogyrophana mollusca TaxID=85980 RepID=A0ACB8B1G2_9AGAM|nr:hypothetical protein BV22DRAFT_862577 [Leucogyrophana mollusca]